MNKYSFHVDRRSMRHVIDQICHNPKLSNWEKDFIKNVKQHYINENKRLSDKQMETLSDMWEKY